MTTAPLPAGNGDIEAFLPRANVPMPVWNLTLTHRCRHCGALMHRFTNGRWATVHAGRWNYNCPRRFFFRSHRPR